ncbi:hypothetical protein Ga0466249_001810 [Sporomusaceae bacterium BoRhaA]|uniref:hypothetical protein n=1 Tax=Pelorhabdus rhamnosifermentans TaxID=2772457 RepID=UPI001C0642F6|nr:hypothetical protein [Pelorhabdus rhamnosifermentans]MBU2700705.1 hypothetical protein [Pelorhabdus rhamnosifermentans]
MNSKANKKQQTSNTQSGTMTAKYDINGDYSSSMLGNTGATSNTASSSTTEASTAEKNKQSKAKYGTMTASLDANNDYSE